MARSGDAPAGELGELPARAGDIAALRFLLGAARRVTVAAAPESGKSALAAAGAATRADFPDGTWIVPLGAVTDGALVPHAVARALGLPEELGLSQLDALRTGLRGKRLLIILSDCGLVASACADLAAALERCPGVHLAATVMAPSRH